MRARLPVGFTSGRRMGAARSGSMVNSSELERLSSWAAVGPGQAPRQAGEPFTEGKALAEPAKTAQQAVATDPQSAARTHFERWGFRPLPGPVSLGRPPFEPLLFGAVPNSTKLTS